MAKKKSMTVEQLRTEIGKLNEMRADLEKERANIVDVIESNKARLKDVGKDLKQIDKKLVDLKAKLSDSEAREEISVAVDNLLKTGVSVDEILGWLKK